MTGFDVEQLRRLRDVMAGHVHGDTIGGVAWLVARDDEVEAGVQWHAHPWRTRAGSTRHDLSHRVDDETDRRSRRTCSSSRSAGCALDDPVDDLLPELADRRVLVDPRGPIDGDTVPAQRPITVHDVLTFRLGLGMDFEAPWPQPLLEAMGALGLGAGAAGTAGTARARRVDAPAVDAPPALPARRAVAVQHRCRRARRAHRPGAPVNRSTAVPPRARASSRSGWSTPASRPRTSIGSASCYATEPGNRRTARLRPARRAMDQAARVSVGRRRSRVDGRRPARVRPHAAVRRPAARRLAAAVARRRSRR